MKKKLLVASLIPAFCLMSCSDKLNPVGVYSFRLGKASETHVGVSIELTDTDHIAEKLNPETGERTQEVVGKEFKASLDVGDSIKINLADYDIPYIPGLDIDELNRIVNELINKTLHDIKGYYEVSDVERDYGRRLKLGASISLPEDSSLGGIDIPPFLVEHVIASFINEKSITLQLPVSFEDLLMQLCWYGLYINPKDSLKNYMYTLDTSKLPGEKNEDLRIGTHPVKKYDADGKTVIENQIDLMNEAYACEFSNTPVYVDNVCVGKITEASYEITNPSTGNITTVYDHYFYTLSGESRWLPAADKFNAVIYTKNILYSTFDIKTDVSIDLDKSELERVGFTKILGPYDASSGEKIDRNLFMQKPFVFRDYNDIKIGLNKE